MLGARRRLIFRSNSSRSCCVFAALIAAIAGAAFVTTFLICKLVENFAVDAALVSAGRTADEFKQIRDYYSKMVVDKIADQPTLSVSVDHRTSPHAIPFPVTMLNDLGHILDIRDGTSIKIYSPYPFKERQNRELDEFGQAAWRFLDANPYSTYSQVDSTANRKTVRVATADHMTDISCVRCHNSMAGSPKTDWKIGDLRGVLEVDVDVGWILDRSRNIIFAVTCGAIMLFAGLFVGAVAIWIRREFFNQQSASSARSR